LHVTLRAQALVVGAKSMEFFFDGGQLAQAGDGLLALGLQRGCPLA
jgi:hypothetical protein